MICMVNVFNITHWVKPFIILSEYDQEIPQSHTADQLNAPGGRATVIRHQEDKVKQLNS